MMNGLPGAMGIEIAAACLRRDGVTLAPFCLTGRKSAGEVTVDDGRGGSSMTVTMYGPDDMDKVASLAKEAYPEAGSLVCIDFTHPSAVNGNAEWYASAGLPFVMGTTGGDRDALFSGTKASGTYAVIAPNMAKQIVALQAALEGMARDFPGSFDGYKLTVVESHQSTKADTSGTAKVRALRACVCAISTTFHGAAKDHYSLSCARRPFQPRWRRSQRSPTSRRMILSTSSACGTRPSSWLAVVRRTRVSRPSLRRHSRGMHTTRTRCRAMTARWSSRFATMSTVVQPMRKDRLMQLSSSLSACVVAPSSGCMTWLMCSSKVGCNAPVVHNIVVRLNDAVKRDAFACMLFRSVAKPKTNRSDARRRQLPVLNQNRV
jgi:dihydrodipicolinate reductase